MEDRVDTSSVDGWVADVRPQAPAANSGRWFARIVLPLLGALAAAALLLAFTEVVEGSVRNAPLKRQAAERLAATTARCAATGGDDCDLGPHKMAARKAPAAATTAATTAAVAQLEP